jgi:hypothetical protein
VFAVQGHLPGAPQPHFPGGLGPFIGYVAAREPRPYEERPPEEPGWDDIEGDTRLDAFDDVGEWEAQHRPLIKVVSVIVCVSLVAAGLGTLLDIVLSVH